MTAARDPRRRPDIGGRAPLRRREPPQPGAITLSWPWWLHPAWALVLLTGSTAVISMVLPREAYAVWGVPKFLTDDLALQLLVCITAMFVGILLTSGAAARGGTARLEFDTRQLIWLRRLYRVTFTLLLGGYGIWAASAAVQGVGLADLAAVLQRQEGGIGDLKSSVRPIGGVTTFTQLGPLIAPLGYLLHRLGVVGRGYLWVLPLAALRFFFYAERLALIEVLVPLLLIVALTSARGSWRFRVAQVAPLFATPALWALFAASEYNRSWIFYQTTSTIAFPEWVSLRLLGYYTTSFNNSALLNEALANTSAVPYFSISSWWNAPLIEQIFPHPGIRGVPPEDWWTGVLAANSNPEFTSVGSFLTVTGELGTVLGIISWLVTGAVLGALFTLLTRGELVGLFATLSIFVGVLELPRLVYWSLGRTTPFILALIVLAVFYPRRRSPREGRIRQGMSPPRGAESGGPRHDIRRR